MTARQLRPLDAETTWWLRVLSNLGIRRRLTPAPMTTDVEHTLSTQRAVARILVIEDDADTRLALVAVLRHHDFAVASATDGFLALRLAANFRPDLIVLDLGLPLLDGRSFLARLRERSWIRAVPVVVVSGIPDADLVVGADVAACLTKPLDLPTFVGVINSLLLSRPPSVRIA